jgi:hypothetical protein
MKDTKEAEDIFPPKEPATPPQESMGLEKFLAALLAEPRKPFMPHVHYNYTGDILEAYFQYEGHQYSHWINHDITVVKDGSHGSLWTRLKRAWRVLTKHRDEDRVVGFAIWNADRIIQRTIEREKELYGS